MPGVRITYLERTDISSRGEGPTETEPKCRRAEAELLTFLSRWLMPASMVTLETVVRRCNGKACARYRLLLEEIRGHFGDASISHGYLGPIFLPEDLVRRVEEATTGSE